jgi:hypothetical protein
VLARSKAIGHPRRCPLVARTPIPAAALAAAGHKAVFALVVCHQKISGGEVAGFLQIRARTPIARCVRLSGAAPKRGDCTPEPLALGRYRPVIAQSGEQRNQNQGAGRVRSDSRFAGGSRSSQRDGSSVARRSVKTRVRRGKLVNALAQAIEICRLGNAVDGAAPDCFSSKGRPRRGDADNWDRPRARVNAALLLVEKGQAVHDRHHQIENDDGGLMLPEHGECLESVRRCEHAMTTVLQRELFEVPSVAVVFDHENCRHLGAICRERRMRHRQTLPRVWELSAQRRAKCVQAR